MSQPATVALVENGIFPDNKRYRYSDSIHLRDPSVVDEPLKQQKVSQFQTISDDSGSDNSTVREPEAGSESLAGPSHSPQKMEQPSQENNATHSTEMPHAVEAPHAVGKPSSMEAPRTLEVPPVVEVSRPTEEGPSTEGLNGNPASEASQLSTTPEAPSSPHLREAEENQPQSKTPTRSFKDLFRRTANHIRERSSYDLVRPPSRLSYRKGRPSTSTRHAEDFTLPEVNEPNERQRRHSSDEVNENMSMTSRSSGNSHTSLTFENLRKLMKVSTGASLLGKSKSGLHSNQDEPLFQIKFPTLNNLKDQLRFSNFGSPARFGAEPKAKQPMTSDLDFIEVDTLELSDTFVNASRGLSGKRREIAKGSTATVKVMYRKGAVSVIPYAVKEFRKPKSNVDGYAFATQIKSEFSIANSLHHPNIVETICLCTHAGRWNHVMEYCGQGELFSLVQKNYLKMDDKLCLFKQLLQGVAYLHSNGIAHRDIKLENLLMTDHGHLKITDFGVAVVFRGPHPGLRGVYADTEELDTIRKCEPGICGSLPYIAPEVLRKDCEYDPRPIDIWSCGIVCLALFFQGTPWQEATRLDPNYLRFLAGWEKFLQENADGTLDIYNYPSCGRVFNAFPKPPFRRILLQMLQPDPNRRVTIHEVLNDRWVKRIECCCPDPEIMRTAVKYTEVDIDESQLAKKIHFKRHNHCPPNKRGFFPRNRPQV